MDADILLERDPPMQDERKELSRRQQGVLRAIAEYWAQSGSAPSYREIMDGTDILSTSHVDYALKGLAGAGLVRDIHGGKSRQVRLTKQGWEVAGVDRPSPCPACGRTE